MQQVSNIFPRLADLLEQQKGSPLVQQRDLVEPLLHSGLPARYQRADLLTDFPNIPKDLIGQSLYIHGERGTGKTHLAGALLREWVWSCYLDRSRRGQGRARFVTTTQLLMDLRKSFQHKEGPSEGELVDRHVNAPLLVLDDLGTEQLKDYAFTVLFHIIDQRYTWGRPLIVTSNLDLGALSAGFSDRVASRLAEMCAVLDLGNQDRRVGR